MPFPLSLEKIEIEGGARHGEPAEAAAHQAELLPGLFLFKENVVGNGLVAERWGDEDAVHAETLQEREEIDQFFRIGLSVDGGVRPHAEPFPFRRFDADDSRIEGSRLSRDAVVRPFHAVNVKAERQSRMGRICGDKGAGENAVGTEVKVLFHADQRREQFSEVSVEEGLAARDRDDRGV